MKATTRKIDANRWAVYEGDELIGEIEKREGRGRWRAIPPADGRRVPPFAPRSRNGAINHLQIAKRGIPRTNS